MYNKQVTVFLPLMVGPFLLCGVLARWFCVSIDKEKPKIRYKNIWATFRGLIIF